MGWGRTLLLGDIGNRLDIEDAELDISRLKRDMGRAFRKDMSQDEKINALAAENAELKLYLASVIRLLGARGIVSEAELQAIVEAVDSEDGVLDGKLSGDIM